MMHRAVFRGNAQQHSMQAKKTETNTTQNAMRQEIFRTIVPTRDENFLKPTM